MTEQLTTDQILDGLEAEAVELETTPEQQAETEKAQSQAVQQAQESEAAAGMFTGAMEALLKLLYPYVEVDAGTRSGATAVLIPIFEKYGVSLGGKWAAEINAVTFFGMAGFGIYQQIKVHKAEEAANDGKEPKHVAA